MAFKPDQSSRILFALVAKSTSILASHCGVVGNFNDVARDLLLKLDQQAKYSSSPSSMPTRMTYKDGNYLYHYFLEHGQGVIFLCITEDAFPRKIAFDLMDTLAGKLIQQFPYQLQSKVQMSPFCLNGEFEPIIRAEMEEANTNAISYKETKVITVFWIFLKLHLREPRYNDTLILKNNFSFCRKKIFRKKITAEMKNIQAHQNQH